MSAFWVTFERGFKGCVEADSSVDALILGAQLKPGLLALKAELLPYPADPRLNPSSCPSFCWHPEQCVGRSCCPNSRACDD